MVERSRGATADTTCWESYRDNAVLFSGEQRLAVLPDTTNGASNGRKIENSELQSDENLKSSMNGSKERSKSLASVAWPSEVARRVKAK